jgi:hypothetical protein
MQTTSPASFTPPSTDHRYRRIPRRPVSWRARVMVQAPQFAEAMVINLSPEGLGIRCFAPVQADKIYPVAVAVPHLNDQHQTQVIQFKGLVRSVILSEGAYRIGMEYASILPPDQQLLHDWIRKIS